MTPEEFTKQLYENADGDYGLFPPPTEAQHGLNILIKHFLGEDWYSTCSIHNAQVNSEAIYEILKKYPKRNRNIFKFLNKLKRKQDTTN